MSFGIKLKMLRVKYKLDQETMSRRLNISQPVYSRYENDEKRIEDNGPFAERVAEEFKVSLDWLISEDDELPVKDNSANYNMPGAFADILQKQHELNEQILKLLTKR